VGQYDFKIEQFYMKRILTNKEVQQNETNDQLLLEADIVTPAEVDEWMEVDHSTLKANELINVEEINDKQSAELSHSRGCLCSIRT